MEGDEQAACTRFLQRLERIASLLVFLLNSFIFLQKKKHLRSMQMLLCYL